MRFERSRLLYLLSFIVNLFSAKVFVNINVYAAIWHLHAWRKTGRVKGRPVVSLNTAKRQKCGCGDVFLGVRVWFGHIFECSRKKHRFIVFSIFHVDVWNNYIGPYEWRLVALALRVQQRWTRVGLTPIQWNRLLNWVQQLIGRWKTGPCQPLS